MRDEILNAMARWGKEWEAHSHVGSEDAARAMLLILNNYVDRGDLDRDRALSIFMYAGHYIMTGERQKLDDALDGIS